MLCYHQKHISLVDLCKTLCQKFSLLFISFIWGKENKKLFFCINNNHDCIVQHIRFCFIGIIIQKNVLCQNHSSMALFVLCHYANNSKSFPLSAELSIIMYIKKIKSYSSNLILQTSFFLLNNLKGAS